MDNLARKITVIPGNPELVRQQTRPQKLRVAAYCRVSTDDEEQLTSYENQIAAYTQKISENPGWILAGIFPDEGLTGTSTKKREQFNKMMALCKRGKIDLILTKSISRFARNTLDSLDYVRKLKLMGVGVFFERENINTLNMSNEMVFTMLAAFAQAESESISENVRWGKRHSMKQGKVPFQYKRILGYERGEDGKPMIVPEQAATVRLIYAYYLSGYSIRQIKERLEADGIPSASGEPKWSEGSLHYMLRNEKYVGDALLQKTYVVDCISKQVRKNQGEIAQFYIENNHPAIISRDVFGYVQEEIARRSAKRRVSDKALTEKGKYSGKYTLSELLVCGECGARYKRVTWARGGKKKIVWRCINRLENGTKYCKASPTLEECRLHDAILRALNGVLEIREDILAGLDDVLPTLTGAGGNGYDRIAAQQEIQKIEKIAGGLLELSKENSMADDFFEGQLAELYDKRAQLLNKMDQVEQEMVKSRTRAARLQRLMASIRSAPAQLDEYSDAAGRELLESVKVIDADNLVVVIKSGIEIEAVMES